MRSVPQGGCIFFGTVARGPLRARQCDMKGDGLIRTAQEVLW